MRSPEANESRTGKLLMETETPVKPTESPSKPKEGDDLGERVKRIIREIPDPTPQPGGE
ncbi:MAG: hypothetical protein QF609_06135 [Gammaproteobacteria bacterium]|nr:hypothetical protein [Gammaproteobacteria bacterium]